MKLILLYLAGLVLGGLFALPIALSNKKPTDEPATIEEDPVSDEVRAVLWSAYSDMRKRHSPHLWRLTACLSQSVIPLNVALFALESTISELSELYDVTALTDAVMVLKTLKTGRYS